MADLETQIRQLADRRFAATQAVEFIPDEAQIAMRPRREGSNTRPIDGTEMIKMRSNETVQPPRRWYVLGAAAGIVAVAVLALALVTRDDETPAPAVEPTLPAAELTLPEPTPEPTPIELDGADGNTAANEAFAALVDAYEAFNRGDGMGWVTARGAPAAPPTDTDDYQIQYVEAAHVAGARYEVTSCTYDGFGESRGELQGVDGHRFTCRTKMIDEFTRAAGLDFDEVFNWTVADGEVIDAVSTFRDLNSLQLFMRQLGPWVERQHPEIAFTAIEWYAYPLASEVPAVLTVVDEFVASNDAYPLTNDE